jgi:competence CoiA-like predicted nuclease
MTRFIQQRVKPLVSRFIPSFLCPSCGSGISLKEGQKREGKVKVRRKSKKKDLVSK